MGSGRRRETYPGPHPPSSSPGSVAMLSPSYLHLPQEKLGSVVFGCTHATYKECVQQLIFGLPYAHKAYVENVEPGMPLFLFNFSDRKMHGIFEAAGHGMLNINPYGWTQDGTGKTAFPAQVRVRVRQLCQPLSENTFKDAMSDNYYNEKHFWFELNHVQTNTLISLFTENMSKKSDKLSTKPQTVTISPRWNKSGLDPLKAQQEEEDEGGWSKSRKATRSDKFSGPDAPPFIHSPQSFVCAQLEERTEARELSDSCCDDDVNGVDNVCSWVAGNYFCDSHSLESKENGEREPVVKQQLPQKPVVLGGSSNLLSSKPEVPSYVQNDNQYSLEESEQTEQEPAILEKSKRLQKSKVENNAQEGVEAPATVHVVSNLCETSPSEWERIARESCPQEQTVLREERERVRESLQSMDSPAANPIQKNLELYASGVGQLLKDVDQLRKRNAVLERTQAKMASDLQLLKLKVERMSLQSENQWQGDGYVNEKCLTGNTGMPTVYLLGGSNGDLLLRTVDAFCPGTNELFPVVPMLAARSYAAASVLNGEVYVFGGGNRSSCYDTVETYNSCKNEWSACAPMGLSRGSLAGATVGDRIFALGGENAHVKFADVECYDAHLGMWIRSTSMLNKRFGFAAAELDGALYAVGGYNDESKYLKSVERFDPREGLWTTVAPMNNKRRGLSAAALRGKLFAIGGFDGTKVSQSVEYYEPRTDTWIEMENRMHVGRAYGAVAKTGDCLYMIGGHDGNACIDLVECYHETTGWETVEAAVVGRRCFLASAVLV